MPVVTPMVAVAFAHGNLCYQSQIGTINQIFWTGCKLADESEENCPSQL